MLRSSLLPSDLRRSGNVVWVAMLLIAAQLAVRGWALYPSWFFADDFRLLYDATHASLSLDYLLRPFDSQFMPAGRLIAWLVAQSGSVNWAIAASITLALQLLASLACLWMLLELFGVRWAILGPLTLYLFSAMTVPALMWWAAGLNQLPLQAVAFVIITLGTRYFRSRSLLALGLTILVIAIGLLAYVKAALLIPVLAYLALGYFTSGSLSNRFRDLMKKYLAAVILTVAVSAAYAVYYVSYVPQPFENFREAVPWDVADSMLGTAFVTGALGGPWAWWETNLPLALAAPPSWTVHASWSFASLVLMYGWLLRRRTLRAWGLLFLYLIAILALLMTSRGVLFGSVAGLDYRYLTDAVAVLALVLGLVFMPLRGSVECSEPRDPPILLRPAPSIVPVLIFATVSVGGLVSTALYVNYWHADNQAAHFLKRTRADLAKSSSVVHLVDDSLPATVMPDYTKPYNRASRMVTLLPGEVAFPEASPRLMVLGEDGGLYSAAIQTGLNAEPGPVAGCGWTVEESDVTVPLDGETFDWTWWLRIGYLASQDSPARVTVGGETIETHVSRGAHSLYIRAGGSFSEVEIGGLAEGVVMCIDTIEVGDPVAGVSQ